jgi:hypothetical protein
LEASLNFLTLSVVTGPTGTFNEFFDGWIASMSLINTLYFYFICEHLWGMLVGVGSICANGRAINLYKSLMSGGGDVSNDRDIDDDDEDGDNNNVILTIFLDNFFCEITYKFITYYRRKMLFGRCFDIQMSIDF